MITIELTDEEFYILRDIMQRIVLNLERKPRNRKWIRHDGCMINLETGSMLDTASNKFVIDQQLLLENMTKLRLESTLDK